MPRDDEKPQLNATDLTVAMQTKIKIRIHQSVVDRVLDFCTFDASTSDGDAYYIVNFPFIENDCRGSRPWDCRRMARYGR